VDYENRQPPEGINVTREHPLRQFLRLAIAAAVLLVIVVVVLQFTGAFLAKRIPFAVERRVIESMDIEFGEPGASPEMVTYLRVLAARLSAEMPMPDGMRVTVHYNPAETFNAFATIGGNLIFFRGLLERLPHENALAMVLAHEIAHVLHRDPVAGLGGGLASAATLAMVTGNAGAAGNMLGKAGVLTGMEFTRRMEEEADRAALAAVAAVYGHVAGADTLFALIAETRSRSRVPDWLGRFTSTHPLDADRIRDIAARAEASGWSTVGETTPLPAGFADWLAAGD